jgi:hypothetical protein
MPPGFANLCFGIIAILIHVSDGSFTPESRIQYIVESFIKRNIELCR